MRLDPETISHLVRALREHFGPDAEVWLFGSGLLGLVGVARKKTREIK